MVEQRRKCEFSGCNKFGRNKGYYKGKTVYGRFCELHHRKRDAYYTGKQLIDNYKCSKCGWDMGPCDRHRINPKQGYTRENVVSLCPNCHRLITLKIIEL
jgi:predicted RNA-binding Zn-ribbon protein involved in translation (DUF1610 family)